MIGYQYATPEAFVSYYQGNANNIDSYYVGGVSLTHGQSPRQHIWTFAAALDEIQSPESYYSEEYADSLSCPCMYQT